ncbi:hypothetical protein K461DRAFT_277780 [Myriangium duriaei CBS 260.36]|uniref:Uncharacterized protein n=1 Tax=Myriangium duriaei CBS 260.36 TaxID=1168546 RepID=A0A9P4J016_9PEZI|nr:hypothetical protein K461DRAFT_277780 [Myriangium duriaei CBS 260.36]
MQHTVKSHMNTSVASETITISAVNAVLSRDKSGSSSLGSPSPQFEFILPKIKSTSRQTTAMITTAMSTSARRPAAGLLSFCSMPTSTDDSNRLKIIATTAAAIAPPWT